MQELEKSHPGSYPEWPLEISSKQSQQVLRDTALKRIEEMFEALQNLKNSKTHRTTHMPEFDRQLEKIEKKINSNQDFNRLWKKIQSESIDYGLMEKSDKIYVVKSEFEWNDLGSWDAVFDVSPMTKDKNVIRGKGLVIDGKNNLIDSNNHFTAVVGVDNIVVVNYE